MLSHRENPPTDLQDLVNRLMVYIELKLDRKLGKLEFLVDNNNRNLRIVRKKIESAREEVVQLADSLANEGVEPNKSGLLSDDIRFFFRMVKNGKDKQSSQLERSSATQNDQMTIGISTSNTTPTKNNKLITTSRQEITKSRTPIKKASETISKMATKSSTKLALAKTAQNNRSVSKSPRSQFVREKNHQDSIEHWEKIRQDKEKVIQRRKELGVGSDGLPTNLSNRLSAKSGVKQRTFGTPVKKNPPPATPSQPANEQAKKIVAPPPPPQPPAKEEQLKVVDSDDDSLEDVKSKLNDCRKRLGDLGLGFHYDKKGKCNDEADVHSRAAPEDNSKAQKSLLKVENPTSVPQFAKQNNAEADSQPRKESQIPLPQADSARDHINQMVMNANSDPQTFRNLNPTEDTLRYVNKTIEDKNANPFLQTFKNIDVPYDMKSSERLLSFNAADELINIMNVTSRTDPIGANSNQLDDDLDTQRLDIESVMKMMREAASEETQESSKRKINIEANKTVKLPPQQAKKKLVQVVQLNLTAPEKVPEEKQPAPSIPRAKEVCKSPERNSKKEATLKREPLSQLSIQQHGSSRTGRVEATNLHIKELPTDELTRETDSENTRGLDNNNFDQGDGLAVYTKQHHNTLLNANVSNKSISCSSQLTNRMQRSPRESLILDLMDSLKKSSKMLEVDCDKLKVRLDSTVHEIVKPSTTTTATEASASHHHHHVVVASKVMR